MKAAALRVNALRFVVVEWMCAVRRWWGLFVGAVLAVGCLSACQATAQQGDPAAGLARGASSHVFDQWAGPPITVWTYAPENGALGDLPVVVVMHGVNRDGDRYRDEWIASAREHGLIVLAPMFTRDEFPGAAGYNLGNMFDAETDAAIDESLWSFSAIDALFEDAVARIGGTQTSYALYGHSAGAQFVHRYLYFKPETRAGMFLVANAGWYTMPVFDEAFPYGLQGSGLNPAGLNHAFEAEVAVLLGDKDIDATDPNLRRTPEAMAQGPHRFARGQTFFETAKARAREEGVAFGWRQVTVPGAHHSNGLMAPAAAALVRQRASGG